MFVRTGALAMGAIILLAAGSAGAAPLQMEMIDVEGGGATLFVTPQGKSVLLDAGWPDEFEAGGPHSKASAQQDSSSDRIVAAARRMGVRQIDYLVVTHYHLDHVGGAMDLLKRIPVRTIVDHGPNHEISPNGSPPPQAPDRSAQALYARYVDAIPARPRRIVHAGDTLKIDELTLTFIASDGAVIDDAMIRGAPTPHACDRFDTSAIEPGENFRSIGVLASFGAARILSLADATHRIEGKLVCPANKLGAVDLFIVSHHGSAQSNSRQLLEAIAPRVALMGNGPSKGGDRTTFENIAEAPSRPILWQQHSAVRSPEVDRPSDYVANLGTDSDGGHALRAEIWMNGAMRITNARNGYSEKY